MPESTSKGKKEINGGRIAELYSNYGIFFILILVILGGSTFSDKFLSTSNILSVLNQISLTGILACGVTMLLISANIDLSVGTQVIMANVTCALVVTTTGSVVLAILSAILIAVLGGAFNGIAVSYFGLNGFIMTLAMQFVFRGVAYIIVDGTPIYGTPGITPLAQTKLFDIIPILIVFMILLAIIVHLVLTKTSFGRYLYAIGGNRSASEAAGIDVKRMVFYNFIIMGVFAGITGVLFTARANSGQPNGADMTFDAIIATVLGGTSMIGGVGLIAGTIAGALVVGIINNVMNLGGVSPYYQDIVKGLIIFISILIDKKTREVIMKV